MIAPAHLATDDKTAFMNEVAEVLNLYARDKILAVAMMELPEIETHFNITRAEASYFRRQARRHITDVWSFEDAAWERE